MSVCCEIGCRERLPLGISVEGNPHPALYAAPVVKNPPRKAHKDPVIGGVLHSLSVYMPLVIIVNIF
ncbi:Hypothetical protein FKW44_001506 [Caligus rogercresseyi]|uniref:Uncharacterized protein n=1 Tax=Caligus rogercresseyi TaxID=217165 RepID=A0A7T8KIU8_CALRO|nr:Hypothetical protein FKW44_001506 [Caligus rogercresseyi]